MALLFGFWVDGWGAAAPSENPLSFPGSRAYFFCLNANALSAFPSAFPSAFSLQSKRTRGGNIRADFFDLTFFFALLHDETGWWLSHDH
jgi:hypothetical protein